MEDGKKNGLVAKKSTFSKKLNAAKGIFNEKAEGQMFNT